MDAVIWFRRDVRLHDNPALIAASRHARQNGGQLRAIFIGSSRKRGER